MNILFQVLIILLLTLISGFFAMSEIAIVSSRKARLKQKADEGKKNYKQVLSLADNPGPFMSTIQVGITLIGILTGALGEAAISSKLGTVLEKIPLFAPYAYGISFILVVIGITLISLIIGELVPKRIALMNPEAVAAHLVTPVRILSMLFYPFERMLTALTDFILRLLKMKDSKDPPITEEELVVLLKEGRKAGVFQAVEQRAAETSLYLDDKGTRPFLTPRVDVVYLDIGATAEEILCLIKSNNLHSVFPVCDGTMDEVLGTVDSKKILAAMAENCFNNLKDFLEPAIFVPETVSALKVLNIFREKKVDMVFIIDEYGGILGIMTTRNILEKLFGEVVIRSDDAPKILKRDDGSYLVDGSLPFDDFERFFDCKPDSEQERGEYHTLAGFILKRMGRIPTVANYFVWETFYFEVMEMDGNRIDKVMIRRFEKRSRSLGPAVNKQN